MTYSARAHDIHLIRRHQAPDRALIDPLRRTSGSSTLLPVKCLLVALVMFQRFVVPGTSISVALPVVFAMLAVLALRGHVQADPVTFGLFLGAMSVAVLMNALSSAGGNPWFSLNSLLLLIVIYLPLSARLSPGLRRDLPELLEFFQKLMVAAAVACVLQWAAQVAGWQFTDLLGVLPENLLASSQDFNLSYPLYYGSAIYKANGVVFLEASFASQFLALAIIVQLLLRGRSWRLVLFGAALLATLSGTGLLLLAGGLVVLMLRRGGRWASRYVVGIAIAVAVVGLTPAGNLIADRSTESSQQGSSGNIRFVAPYENVLSAVFANPTVLAIGRGAGTIDRDTDFFSPLGVDANYPALPKLLGEYGLPTTLIFFAFVSRVYLWRVPSPTLAAVAIMLYLVLSSALLQPPIVYLCWVLTGLFSSDAPRSTRVIRTMVYEPHLTGPLPGRTGSAP